MDKEPLTNLAENVDITHETRPLADVLCELLRERILTGGVAPGAELRQEVLARQFGVSRVPVREALNRLQAEGLIVLRPRRGFAVTSLDIAEIIEIFELRMVLEQHALQVATLLRTEADVRDVESLVVKMESCDPQSEGYLTTWLDLNREFHARLIDSARRTRLSSITANLRDSIEPYIRIESHVTGEVEDAAHEHRAIFDAFKARDATRAGDIVRDHCLGSMTRLVKDIRERNIAAGLSAARKTRRG
jgi:DNA-binding GntR family transcriptional regulator